MSLIEIMVVVAIMALVSSVVTVGVMAVLERSKIRTARIQVNALASALEHFKMEYRRFPTLNEGLSVLAAERHGNPPIVRTVPKDPWNHDYVYLCPGAKDRFGFDVYSLGPDGAAGTRDDVGNWPEGWDETNR